MLPLFITGVILRNLRARLTPRCFRKGSVRSFQLRPTDHEERSKKAEALLYSTIGITFMFFVILGANVIFSGTPARVDMQPRPVFTR